MSVRRPPLKIPADRCLSESRDRCGAGGRRQWKPSEPMSRFANFCMATWVSRLISCTATNSCESTKAWESPTPRRRWIEDFAPVGAVLSVADTSVCPTNFTVARSVWRPTTASVAGRSNHWQRLGLARFAGGQRAQGRRSRRSMSESAFDD